MAGSGDEIQVCVTIQTFYGAMISHDWTRLAEVTTEDFTHIDPIGGWTRGQEAMRELMKEVQSTFLKDVTDTPDLMEIRFAAPGVAVATVPSILNGTYLNPDGIAHVDDRQIRTFVVVKRDGRWLILQDQNTVRIY